MTSWYDPFSAGHQGEHQPSSPRHEEGTPLWMISIADLFSLLLSFFVLLYSMSAMERDKWTTISDSLRESVRTVDDKSSSYTAGKKMLTIEQEQLQYGRNLNYLLRIMDARFHKLEQAEGVTIHRGENRVTVSLQTNMLFRENGTALDASAIQTIGLVAEFLGYIRNAVTIEGHAAEGVSAPAPYTSNWEYSLAQADAVANALRRNGYTQPMDIYGMGISRNEKPAVKGLLQGKNRSGRIDIVVRENVANF